MFAVDQRRRSRLPQGRTPFDLAALHDYEAWREAKLDGYPRLPQQLKVAVGRLGSPTPSEREAIRLACERANMAIYVSCGERDETTIREELRAFGRAFDLEVAEDHRSAEVDGIVRIEPVVSDGRLGYIPYTDRPINWHTDGYYSYHGVEKCILAMLLHCVRPASTGGVNRLLDPEIAYIRLRDQNPNWVAALMRSDAMAIPENVEPDGKVRPINIGPVFFVEPNSDRLGMRYTARKRSVAWRDDPETRKAAARLEEILESDPLVVELQLGAGEGLICNNVLHDRSGFGSAHGGASRLLFRVRYHNRVAGS